MSHIRSFTSPASATTIFATLTNDELVTVPMCAPVYSDGAGSFKLAIGDGSAKAKFIGVVCDLLIPAAQAGGVLGVGVLNASAAQWDVVCGTVGGLAGGQVYYLSTAIAGILTTNPASNVPVIAGLSATSGLILLGTGGGSGISGLTAGKLPIAGSGTSIVDGPLAYNAGAKTITWDDTGTTLVFEQAGNNITGIGGYIPGSPTNPALANFGTFQGQGMTYFKYPVGMNGQTAPLYTLDILSDEHNMTAEDIKIRIGWSGGYDTTAGPIVSRNIVSQANGNRNAGANTLENVAGYFDARNGQINTALHTDLGDNHFDGNTTVGLTSATKTLTVNGNGVIQFSATAAQASNAGTILELASGGAHNYLSFRNPDGSDCGLAVSNVTNGGDGYFTYKRATGWTIGAQNATVGTITPQAASFTGAVGTGNAFWSAAAGTPNGNVVGNPGDLFTNRSGGAGNTLWVKESGNGTNTGWVAK